MSWAHINVPEGFTLKPKQSKLSCSFVTVRVCLQGGGNARGMTVPSAVAQPLPSVSSAHTPFARITRKGHSPPLHLKAVSAAPVTTLPVPWAPAPALPSHTAQPRAPSEWKRSQRQKRLLNDSTAQLNTSFPVKCAAVDLQATSGPKRCAMEGNTVLYDQCCGPHTKRRHTDKHLSAACGTTSVLTGKVSRHRRRCSSHFFLPCTAQWCPIGGTTDSFCCFILSFFKVGEIVSAVIFIYWHFGETTKWGRESKDR